jgi:hypothetical protein
MKLSNASQNESSEIKFLISYTTEKERRRRRRKKRVQRK